MRADIDERRLGERQGLVAIFGVADGGDSPAREARPARAGRLERATRTGSISAAMRGSGGFNLPRERSSPQLRLSPRQREILELASRGLTDKEIAAQLDASVHTIRTHLRRLYREYQLHNKAEAVAAWLEQVQRETPTG